MHPPPFVLGDRESIASYRRLMGFQLERASLHPFVAGLRYSLALNEPALLPCPTVAARRRPLPSLPFGTETQYTLSDPIQVGGRFRSQVWLATPPHDDGDSEPVVLKFIIPSHLPLPAPNTKADGFLPDVKEYYVYPHVVVDQGVNAYNSLVEFQGVTLPYFYGSFPVCLFAQLDRGAWNEALGQITTPWQERGWVLAFEYLKGPDLSQIQKSIMQAEGRGSKYQDFELYLRLVSRLTPSSRSLAHR